MLSEWFCAVARAGCFPPLGEHEQFTDTDTAGHPPSISCIRGVGAVSAWVLVLVTAWVCSGDKLNVLEFGSRRFVSLALLLLI